MTKIQNYYVYSRLKSIELFCTTKLSYNNSHCNFCCTHCINHNNIPHLLFKKLLIGSKTLRSIIRSGESCRLILNSSRSSVHHFSRNKFHVLLTAAVSFVIKNLNCCYYYSSHFLPLSPSWNSTQPYHKTMSPKYWNKLTTVIEGIFRNAVKRLKRLHIPAKCDIQWSLS